MGDIAAGVFRDPLKAQPFDLMLMPKYVASMQTALSRRDHFARYAGLPLSGINQPMLYLNLAYAHFKMSQWALAAKYLSGALSGAKALMITEDQKQELRCFGYWLRMRSMGIDGPQLRSVLNKFCDPTLVSKVYATLEAGKTPLDPYLLHCDTKSCDSCRYRSLCSYQTVVKHICAAGEKYKNFTNGQDRENFQI